MRPEKLNGKPKRFFFLILFNVSLYLSFSAPFALFGDKGILLNIFDCSLLNVIKHTCYRMFYLCEIKKCTFFVSTHFLRKFLPFVGGLATIQEICVIWEERMKGVLDNIEQRGFNLSEETLKGESIYFKDR